MIFTIFGVKLSYATPILLTFDWTGQCDDCQGQNGANNIPGLFLNDNLFQDVNGVLTILYDTAYPSPTLTREMFVSFYYNGSSILKPFTLLGQDLNTEVIGNITRNGNLLLIDTVRFEVPNKYLLLTPGDNFKRTTTRGTIFVEFNPHFWEVGHYYHRGSTTPFSNVWRIRTDCPPNLRATRYGSCVPRGSRDMGRGSMFTMLGELPTLKNKTDIPVNEPHMLAILALGVLGLGLRRKKRS